MSKIRSLLYLIITVSLLLSSCKTQAPATSLPEKVGGQQERFGIFTLQQPVDNSFGLMMTLVQMPGQQWTGSWLVSNEDATQLCGGSIYLLLPD